MLIDVYEDALMGGDPRSTEQQRRLFRELMFALGATGDTTQTAPVARTGTLALEAIEKIAA